jgi:hypothetical protein
MLINVFTSRRLIGASVAAAGLIVAATMGMGVTLGTTAIVLALCLVPGIVVTVLALSGPPTSVSQILYALETKDGRR